MCYIDDCTIEGDHTHGSSANDLAVIRADAEQWTRGQFVHPQKSGNLAQHVLALCDEVERLRAEANSIGDRWIMRTIEFEAERDRLRDTAHRLAQSDCGKHMNTVVRWAAHDTDPCPLCTAEAERDQLAAELERMKK